MAAPIQLRTFSDIVRAVRTDLKIQSSDTTTIDRIKAAINDVYINEVAPYAAWSWLRGEAQLVHDAYVSTGTAAVTNGSVTVTLSSAPTTSKEGYLFSIVGSPIVYRIKAHTASSATVTLEVPLIESTNSTASYRIWTNAIPLPVDCRETFEITHEYQAVPMEGVGLQKYRQFVAANPKLEGRPSTYTTSDYIDPTPYSSVSGLPALSTRASSGLVRTLVFASDVSSLLHVGMRIKITLAGDYRYNGEFVVSSVSTATIQYTATTPLVESATADATLTLTAMNPQGANERYRELLVHPSLSSAKTLLKVDYVKEVEPLVDDTDEPLMPISDRSVLKWGALMLTWRSIMRSEADAQNAAAMYQRKLGSMQGKLTDSQDLLVLTPSKSYLAKKRRGAVTTYNWED